MLNEIEAVATVAVKDLSRAKAFYEGKLGLWPLPADEQDVLVYKSGPSRIFVYKSQYAGTNQATSVTWDVGARVETFVRTLKDKGIAFEHYDMPGMTLQGDVHVAGKMKAAWLKDPDGNILAIVGQ